MLAVMLFLGYYAETPDPGPPDPATSLAIVAAGVAVMAALSFLVNHITLRMLYRPGRNAMARRGIAANADVALRVLMAAIYAASLVESSLPWSLSRAWGLDTGGESFAVQAIGLVPYILLFFAAWLPMYRLHRQTVPGVWTRSSYLTHKARYNLYMLLVWLPFAFLADWLGEFLVVLPFVFLLAVWAFPVVLARAWGCRPMPEGDVLDMVRRMEEKAGAKFSKVLLWEPGGGTVQNAAAVGLFRPFRYLFLTPALIRGMKADELEAVILHELGHVKKRHLLFYFFTSLAGINIAVVAGVLLPAVSWERFAVTVALVLFYFRFVLGWLSRNMERQADLFSLEKSGSAHGLVNALEKLGIAAGSIRLASSWHHLGIAERVEYLRRAERNPRLAATHNANVAFIKSAGYLVSILFVGAMVWTAYEELKAQPAPVSVGAAGNGDGQAHWRRVMRIMPDNPEAALELAYRLARFPDSRHEARILARQAIGLSGPGEARDAAEKLLEDLDR